MNIDELIEKAGKHLETPYSQSCSLLAIAKLLADFTRTQTLEPIIKEAKKDA